MRVSDPGYVHESHQNTNPWQSACHCNEQQRGGISRLGLWQHWLAMVKS